MYADLLWHHQRQLVGHGGRLRLNLQNSTAIQLMRKQPGLQLAALFAKHDTCLPKPAGCEVLPLKRLEVHGKGLACIT